jgi:hypothetical protein
MITTNDGEEATYVLFHKNLGTMTDTPFFSIALRHMKRAHKKSLGAIEKRRSTREGERERKNKKTGGCGDGTKICWVSFPRPRKEIVNLRFFT